MKVFEFTIKLLTEIACVGVWAYLIYDRLSEISFNSAVLIALSMIASILFITFIFGKSKT